ncbi:MAG: thiamine pyrophosphate-dependent dehydrogenase E1 component subunit alpha [Candidatus Nanopelagicaceae bacterium]|nr:thiamine pyrophosphate-dependent dehydrogenase E1 component subunit alpha [Candidatus Nanopelagicaceae bacterium]
MTTLELLTGHPLESSVNARYALLTMSRIRKLEEAVEDLFGRGMMHGTMHLSIGQEASPTGVCMALDITDQITSTHRGHGHCVAKGADLMRMVAELLGKENGYCGGRGGSMHIADVETGNLGANGIVGGGIPIAIGAALASKMMKKGTVAVSFFGDGAMNEGAFHEAANLAAIWKLPVILVCENNKYGMSSSTELAFAIDHLSERGLGYGIPGYTVDGNDVAAVYEATEAAVKRAKAGEGPTLLEFVTYRWKGHSRSDKNLYRTKEEIDEWKKKDPILFFEHVVRDKGLLTEDEIAEVHAQATSQVIAAVNEAMKGKPADPATLLDAVFKKVNS